MSSTAAPSIDRRAALPLAVGLSLSVGVLVAVAMDQQQWRTIADQVVAPGGVARDSAPLYLFLYITGGLGVAAWIISIWGTVARRDWVRTFASGAFPCGLAVAAYVLMARGFSDMGFPTVWGLLLLVPCLPGGIALLMLWRRPAQV